MQDVQDKIKAVVNEIGAALENLEQSGRGRTIFTNRMGLTPEEQEKLRDLLGKGDITIKLNNTAEPAEWQESGISGVWYGVFYDQGGAPLLETLEIGFFPEVAASQPEDIVQGIDKLKKRVANI